MSKIFIATFTYFATGEGYQENIFIRGAKDMDDFKKMFNTKHGEYFAIGTDFYDTYPENDKILKKHLSETMQAHIKEVMENGFDCWYQYDLQMYFNCS